MIPPIDPLVLAGAARLAAMAEDLEAPDLIAALDHAPLWVQIAREDLLDLAWQLGPASARAHHSRTTRRPYGLEVR